MESLVSNEKLSKIAKKVIEQCLSINEGETVVIYVGREGLNFAEELAYYTSLRGAHPFIVYSDGKLSYRILRDIDPKHLQRYSKLREFIAKEVDVEIIVDDPNPDIERKIPQDKVDIRAKALESIREIKSKRILEKSVKIALIGYPTKNLAKNINMDYNELFNIWTDCMSLDFIELYEYGERVKSLFENADKIEIYGKDTELELSVKGRKFLNDCGIWEKQDDGFMNLPCGEVFVAPVEDSANGEIYFDLPCMWHFGKYVKGVWFKFKDGKLVEYYIEEGQENFEDVFNNSSGDKDKIGELGIGTNKYAKFTNGWTIIDEKVKGTIHIAIGENRSYGGKNKATLHWDFFKDMSKGEIYVDGKLVMKNGKFIFEE